MVDFHNPAVIKEDALVLVKFWHVVDGIFIWEFFINLDYEWSVIRRRRPYRWTIWIYSLTRVSTLISVSLNMVEFDSPKSINCQIWIIFQLVFTYLAIATASLLIVIRTIAIWDRNRIAVAIAMSVWLTNIAFLIYGITELHAAWVPTQSVCALLNIESSKRTLIVMLVTDVVLLLTMLVGLLRLRQHGPVSSLWQLLWRQGLIWLLLATVAEVTPVIFIGLNLNRSFNLMFQVPALIVMSIAATRLHRSISGFSTSSGYSYDIPHIGSGRRTASSDPKRDSTVPISLDRLDVAVHTSSQDDPPAHAGQYGSYHDGTYIIAETQSQDKPIVLVIDGDLENGIKDG